MSCVTPVLLNTICTTLLAQVGAAGARPYWLALLVAAVMAAGLGLAAMMSSKRSHQD